jgi:hypothetical protein
MKKNLFYAISIFFLLFSCNKTEEINNSPVSVSISNNEDFKWVSRKTAEFSNKVSKHFATLSVEQISEIKKTLQSKNELEKIQLMTEILGFKNQAYLSKFGEEYNSRVEKVSVYIKEHSLNKKDVQSKFEQLTYRNLKEADPCDKYTNCVHRKFAEGGFNGFVVGALGAAFGGGWAMMFVGTFGGAAANAIWHATFGDCGELREACHR